mmetsp:Transcript_26446/g.62745  ORF Transcript_26446/g.62745 Transcript_26446/m.62745 type:complete len:220 (-) Transcript_26446:10-669(-)
MSRIESLFEGSKLGGIKTSSITWTMPLFAMKSASITFATSFSMTPLPLTSISIADPSTVSTDVSLSMLLATFASPKTWYRRTFFNKSVSASSVSTSPSSNFPNASSVGANTVNGPSPAKTSTRPSTAPSAVTRVPRRSSAITVSTKLRLMDGGVSTASMTWITPLLAGMSKDGGSTTTLASLIMMDGLVETVTASLWKFPVRARPSVKSSENTLPCTRW